MSQIIVAGKSFEWSLVSGTTAFKPLLRLGDADELDILRITSSGSCFDVAIRIFTGQYSGGTRRFLGPLLVLGDQFPNNKHPVQVGTLIELRPRLCALQPDEPNASTVESIIQWCNSARFKPVRVNSSGGRLC
jgi:hypothetical protein